MTARSQTGPLRPADFRRRLTVGSIAALLFCYLCYVRTRGISQTFWLLGDQILYWRIALASWRDLPIGGGPSSVGGTTLGPIFGWTLWAVRHLVGPFTGNLPHAGGIGLAILQSAADALLLVAVWRRFGSFALSLAVVLLVGTAPYDMALTATIWNPPLAVVFVKVTLALALCDDGARSAWWVAGTTATALLAVQAHSSAAFFAAPVIASFTLRELPDRRRALRAAAASAAAIALVEIPFLFNLMTQPEQVRSPAIVVNSLSYTLAHPRALRVDAAFRALATGCQFILLRPWTFAWFGTALGASAAVSAYRFRRDCTILGATVGPMACAVAGFSFWQLPFDNYWFLTIAPSAALTMALACAAWRPAAPVVAATLAALVVLAQPARIADSRTLHRLPEYAPLARGSREIRRRTAEIRRIDTTFAVPPSTDRAFLYEVLGGRVSSTAAFTATIDGAGAVTFTPVAPPRSKDAP